MDPGRKVVVDEGMFPRIGEVDTLPASLVILAKFDCRVSLRAVSNGTLHPIPIRHRCFPARLHKSHQGFLDFDRCNRSPPATKSPRLRHSLPRRAPRKCLSSLIVLLGRQVLTAVDHTNRTRECGDTGDFETRPRCTSYSRP